MIRKQKRIIIVWLVVLAFVVPLTYGYMHSHNIEVLNPAGSVSAQQRHLMAITVGLGAIVIIPVYAMLIGFALRYHEDSKHATYSPKLSGNVFAELVWWSVPLAIITTLSLVTWHTSHTLDPHQAISSQQQTEHVQVVALQWKWLFIYPEEQVASVNELYLPVDHPVSFDITADAPMNSFWIPQLGSQIYAMTGMSSKLSLLPEKIGDFRGESANISGEHFADMDFGVHVRSDQAFHDWLTNANETGGDLTSATYQQLAKPGTARPTLYARVSPDMYRSVILKFMGPGID